MHREVPFYFHYYHLFFYVSHDKNVQLIPRNITSVTKITVLSTAKVFILYAKCLIIMLLFFFSKPPGGASSEFVPGVCSAQYRIY